MHLPFINCGNDPAFALRSGMKGSDTAALSGVAQGSSQATAAALRSCEYGATTFIYLDCLEEADRLLDDSLGDWTVPLQSMVDEQ